MKRGVMLLFVMMFVMSIVVVSAADFDNVKLKQDKTFDNKKVEDYTLLQKYKPIKIKNTFGLGKDLFEGYISNHDEVCQEDCTSYIEMKNYEDVPLVDEIYFLTEQPDGSWEKQGVRMWRMSYWGTEDVIRNVCDQVTQLVNMSDITNNTDTRMNVEQTWDDCYEEVTGQRTGWIKYTLGTPMPKGTYSVKLEAKKKPSRSVDWVIKTNGEELIDWATWGGNGTTNVSFINLLAPVDDLFTTNSQDDYSAFAEVRGGGGLLENMTLYTNSSGTWTADSTNEYGQTPTLLIYDGTTRSYTSGGGQGAYHSYAINGSRIFDIVASVKNTYFSTLGSIQYTFHYTNGSSLGWVSPGSFGGNVILNKTYVHPNPNEPVDTLEVRLTVGFGGGTHTTTNYEKWINTVEDITNATSNFTFNYGADSTFDWNVQACDQDGDCGYANANRTATHNSVTLIAPGDGTTAVNPLVEFECNANLSTATFQTASFCSDVTGTWECNENDSISTIYDDFPGSSVNTSKWTELLQTGVTTSSATSTVTGSYWQSYTYGRNNGAYGRSRITTTSDFWDQYQKTGYFRIEIPYYRLQDDSGGSNSQVQFYLGNRQLYGHSISNSNQVITRTNYEIEVEELTPTSFRRRVFDGTSWGSWSTQTYSGAQSLYMESYASGSTGDTGTTTLRVGLVVTYNATNFGDITIETSKNITNDTMWNCEFTDDNSNFFTAVSNYTVYPDITPPSINLSSPVDLPVLTVGDPLNVNWSVSDPALDSCWYVYNSISYNVTCSANTSQFNWVGGQDSLVFYANDSWGNEANASINWTAELQFIAETFEATTLETATEDFTINLSYDSSQWSSSNLEFNYDGTTYSSTVIGAGDSVYASYQHSIPEVGSPENKTFYWILNLTNGTGTYSFTSTPHLQLVNIVDFAICEYGVDDPQLVFNTFSTTDPDTAVPATFTSNWEIKEASGGTTVLSRNYVDSTETNSTWAFCIEPNSTAYTVSVDITVDATDYTPTAHYIVDTDVSTPGENISLYLLNDSESTLTQIIVRDQDNQPVEDAYTTIQRYDQGTDTYYNVGMTISDNQGSDLTYLKWYDTWYRFVVVVDEVVELTQGPQKISATPIILKIGSVAGSDYEKFKNIQYSLIFNNATDNFVLTYVDPSGEVTSACLRTIKRTVYEDEIICDTCASSNSATLYCNIGAEGNGTFIASFYATGSPVYWIDETIHYVGGGPALYEQIGNDDGTGLAIIFAGIVMSLFLITPALGVFGIILGMLGAMALGFQPVDYTAFIGITIVGVAIMWAVQR